MTRFFIRLLHREVDRESSRLAEALDSTSYKSVCPTLKFYLNSIKDKTESASDLGRDEWMFKASSNIRNIAEI